MTKIHDLTEYESIYDALGPVQDWAEGTLIRYTNGTLKGKMFRWTKSPEKWNELTAQEAASLDRHFARQKLELTEPSAKVAAAMVAARAGLGVLVENGWTLEELREAVFNGFSSVEEAEGPGEFNMADGRSCLLGRAVGDYTDGMNLLGFQAGVVGDAVANRSGVDHGFLVIGPDQPGFDAAKDNAWNYGDLAQAWERILCPEWFILPKTKTVRVILDFELHTDHYAPEVARVIGRAAADVGFEAVYSTWIDDFKDPEDVEY